MINTQSVVEHDWRNDSVDSVPIHLKRLITVITMAALLDSVCKKNPNFKVKQRKKMLNEIPANFVKSTLAVVHENNQTLKWNE